MRDLHVFTVFLALLTIPHTAQAAPWWEWLFTPELDPVTRPYLQDGKIPNNAQWKHDHRNPQDWIAAEGSAEAVIDGFYRGNIITDQYENCDDIPVLEVGQNFMRLSDQDRRRVTAFVDHAFGITDQTENGIFHIYHWKEKEAIGFYSKHGLHLQ